MLPPLRAYQARIVAAATAANTLVVLPTGAGKTAVAAAAIVALRARGPALFLVPTCALVEQQARALRQWTGLDVKEFMGGMPVPRAAFGVLASTPKSFHAAQGGGVRCL
jgi:superfamily II DNA or RNA helicase